MGISSGTRRKPHQIIMISDDDVKMNREINQNRIDRKNREIILETQHAAGYNLNPYNMSSSQLEYWVKKIKEEIERKNKELERENKELYKKISAYNNRLYNNYNNRSYNYNNGLYNNYNNNYYY